VSGGILSFTSVVRDHDEGYATALAPFTHACRRLTAGGESSHEPEALSRYREAAQVYTFPYSWGWLIPFGFAAWAVILLRRPSCRLGSVLLFAGAECRAGYGVEGDYEHRFPEQEHESATKPEPTDGAADRAQRDGTMMGRRLVIRGVRMDKNQTLTT